MHPHEHTHDELPGPDLQAVVSSLTSQLAQQMQRSLELESTLVETQKALIQARNALVEDGQPHESNALTGELVE